MLPFTTCTMACATGYKAQGSGTVACTDGVLSGPPPLQCCMSHSRTCIIIMWNASTIAFAWLLAGRHLVSIVTMNILANVSNRHRLIVAHRQFKR